LLAAPAWATESTLIAPGSAWRYLDDGSDQGTAWRERGFDDSAWAAGSAELGYGDGDEATVVGFGPDAEDKYITTYFRRAVGALISGGQPAVVLRLKCDDGAVVHLGGTEVLRANMPEGPITHLTRAQSEVSGDAEAAWVETFIDPALFPVGRGHTVVAVEVHQYAGTDPDISFDLELVAASGVTRGPYLQQGTPTSVIVRWRTDGATDSRVLFGLDQAALAGAVVDHTSTTEHEIRLVGLAPDARYYYAVGSTTSVLAGGHPNSYFVTPPQTGTPKPTRVWVLGDSGTADVNAQHVRAAYEAFTGARHTDLWLMLGDNAYTSGSDGEYQIAVFEMYPSMLARSVLWPTLGNHDARGADPTTQSSPYLDIFSLPTAAEAGGVASGTEAYYAFDYGNIHFICLDSTGSSRAPDQAMLQWLEVDLAATMQDWIVAFWHHPPYSKGSHDSDSEGTQLEMRAFALPILEAGGVDLVLCGHSHSYERSVLIDSHYGTSETLNDTMILDGGDGRPDGDGAYAKATLGPGAHEGTVYAVAGSSGLISGGPLNHPVMHVSLNELGSMVLDFDHDRLDAVFLDDAGQIRDAFAITKGAGRPRFVRILGAPADEQDSYIWPKADDVALTAFEIELDQPATHVDSTVAFGGTPADATVTGLVHVGGGIHRVQLSRAIPLAEWAEVRMTVASPIGIRGSFALFLAHLPCDIVPDGEVTLLDASSFVTQFNGPGPFDRIDLNGDGQVNLNDATLLGQMWYGTSGHANWQGASLPPHPE